MFPVYKVLAPFRAAGKMVEGEFWVPDTEERVEKLKAADCIRDPRDAEIARWERLQASPDKEGREGAPESLEGIKAKDATALIEATDDPELLAKWKASEERKTVATALDARMKELAAADPGGNAEPTE